MRREVHRHFDQLWNKYGIGRNDAYKWLAAKMDMTKAEAHIGMFDEDQCEKAIQYITGYIGQLTMDR